MIKSEEIYLVISNTAWRLASTYKFPDQLRLTEHQIQQYNQILMDGDLIRKYERLAAIQDNFLAYPPFWYHFGNTANAIAGSDMLGLPEEIRVKYKQRAKSHFMQYRKSNDQGLLREDQLSAACALELVDLLDINADGQLIRDLLSEAIRYSGRANDVLQLASIAYLKLGEPTTASGLLRQLVNEQYNTVLNAQLLSSLYVSEYLKNRSEDAIAGYRILQIRVGEQYLYPMPLPEQSNGDVLEYQFVTSQRNILLTKYGLALRRFIESYVVRYGKIIPPADHRKHYEDGYYLDTAEHPQRRKSDYKEVFSKSRSADEYTRSLREIGIPFRILDLLNDLFADVSRLDFVTEGIQIRLSKDIKDSVKQNRDRLNDAQDKLDNGNFAYADMCDLIDLNFKDFTEQFFEDLSLALQNYISTREEMQDFALAEQDLMEFCDHVKIPSPEILFEQNAQGSAPASLPTVQFGPELLVESKPIIMDNDTSNMNTMQDIIGSRISEIILDPSVIEFYTGENAKVDRYFSNNSKLKKDGYLRSQVLAILDDKSQKDDYDLIFTSMAVTPIRNGVVKSPVAYKDIKRAKNGSLVIDGTFINSSIEMEKFYSLIQELTALANPLPERSVFQIKLPFYKK